MRMRKRSSCDSGSGKVPTWCSGFCVAITKNGSGSGTRLALGGDLVLLHRLEQRALRLGLARLISSARMICAKIGPGMEAEGRALAIEDRYADDVGGQQVAR